VADEPRPPEGEPVDFVTVPHVQYVVSAYPRGGFDDTPPHLRAAPACPAPELETASWPRVTTRLGGVSLRLPPDLPARADPRALPERYEGSEILVDLWQGPAFNLALWLGPEGEFPVGVYNVAEEPNLHDWTECAEQVGGREVRIASSRVTTVRGAPEFHVAAYWLVRPDVWMRAAGQSPRREGQEQLLAALRTVEVRG
jgi:hypothetical protein